MSAWEKRQSSRSLRYLCDQDGADSRLEQVEHVIVALFGDPCEQVELEVRAR